MAVWVHPPLDDPEVRWWEMEEVLLEMRRIWFGGEVRPFHGGILLKEVEGELISLVRANPTVADRLTQEARQRRAHVVETPFSRPPDLALQLRRAGFRLVMRQGAYLYVPEEAEGPAGPSGGEGPAGSRPEPPEQPRPETAGQRIYRWLRGHQRSRVRAPLTIEPITPAELPVWNRICWEVFGPRGVPEARSLQEKERAFANMGSRGLWYLARVGQEPVGITILYRGERGSQILAVGTLPRYRRHGVASALVRRAISDWQHSGRGFLFLDTRPGSEAERLYQRLGFVQAYIRSIYAP